MLLVVLLLFFRLSAALVAVFLFLIPYWDLRFGSDSAQSLGDMAQSLLLVIPVLIFAFNFSPAISQYTLAMQRRFGAQADARSSVVLRRTTILLVIFTMGFVWSTILALGSDGLQEAREANLPVLSDRK